MAEKIDTASISYAFGVMSIVFAFFTPLAGLVIGIIGFVQAKREKFAKAKKLNLIGGILSIVMYIVTLLFVAWSVNSGLLGGSRFPAI